MKPKVESEFPGIPDWVWRDSEWAAAIWLFLSTKLKNKKCIRYVDFEARTIDFTRLLNEAKNWSHGELILVKGAASLFNQCEICDLGTAVRVLDTDSLDKLLHAVRMFREGVRIRREGSVD